MPRDSAFVLLIVVTDSVRVADRTTHRLFDSLAGQDLSMRVMLVARGVDSGDIDSLAPRPDATVDVPEATSLSAARNIGLQAAADRGWTREALMVGFPDDDCWYPSGTLATALGEIQAGYCCVIGRYGPQPGLDVDGQQPRPRQELRARLAFDVATSNNTFYGGSFGFDDERFDERLGVGAKYGSSEDLDMAFRALATGPGIYEPKLVVAHPLTPQKASGYYRGNLAVLAKHARHAWWARALWLRQVAVGLVWVMQRRLRLAELVAAGRASVRMLRPRRRFTSLRERLPALVPSITTSRNVANVAAPVFCGVYRTRHADVMKVLVTAAQEYGAEIRLWALDDVSAGLGDLTAGAGPGAKFDLVKGLLRNLPADRDVVIADDDVRITRGSLGDFLAVAAEGGFDIAQPAHDFRSYSSHGITIARPWSIARRTYFVEIGPLLFVKAAAREAVLEPVEGMGFGADVDWAYQAQAGAIKAGIVDSVRIRHLGRVGGGYDLERAQRTTDAALARAGDDWEKLRSYRVVWRPWQARPKWR